MRRERAIDAWWPAASAVLAGWVVIWPLWWLLRRSVRWNGDATAAAVSAMACWFVLVLFGFALWELRQLWVHGPSIELAEPGARAWRHWWVPSGAIVAGTLAGYLLWK